MTDPEKTYLLEGFINSCRKTSYFTENPYSCGGISHSAKIFSQEKKQ
jgi:hypothetical protein